MRGTMLLSAFLSGLLLLPGGAAMHCNGEITTIETTGATLYIDDRSGDDGDINHWIYVESNEAAGLQSGFEHGICLRDGPPCTYLLILNDNCYHQNPDLKIF